MADQPTTRVQSLPPIAVDHADGCFWEHHHPAHSPVWVKRCSFCGAIDGADLRQQVDLIIADAFMAVKNATDRREYRMSRSTGGIVAPGQAYIVGGEKGPEEWKS
jgi:hypothetical protein